jgi:flagellar FliJ protein
MTHADSWGRIKRVAEQRRDASASSLARQVTRAKEAQQKLQVLLEYRQDYRTRFETASRTGMRGEWLRNYQKFLSNLEQAITLQTDAMTALQQEIAEKKKQVDHEQRRAESFRIIADQRSDAADMRERRRQQRLQDEMATRTIPQFVANTQS